MPNELKLITASGDHTARLWDVNNSDIKALQIFHGHTNSIKCAVFRHQDKGKTIPKKMLFQKYNKSLFCY